MQPQSGTDAPHSPGCLRVNKDLRHLKPVCASLYPGSNWKRLGTAGDRPAVYLPHLSELAAEEHVFCPKRAGPFLFVTDGSRCRHRTWHVTSIPATRGEYPHCGEGRVGLPQAVICRDAAAGAAPRPTRMQERPPLAPHGPCTGVTAARRRRPRPLVALPRPTRGAWG